VLEGESGGARCVSGDDQRGDLDDLAFASGGRTGVLLRVGDVSLRRGRVAAVRGHDGEQRVLDRVHCGACAVRRWLKPDRESLRVMFAAWAPALTRG